MKLGTFYNWQISYEIQTEFQVYVISKDNLTNADMPGKVVGNRWVHSTVNRAMEGGGESNKRGL